MNFTATAKKLFITWPPVTAHIKLFEDFSNLVREAVIHELQEGKFVTVPIKDQKILLGVSIAYLKNWLL